MCFSVCTELLTEWSGVMVKRAGSACCNHFHFLALLAIMHSKLVLSLLQRKRQRSGEGELLLL